MNHIKNWQFVLFIFCVLKINIFWAQRSISAAEYFIDNDPGVGNGISVLAEDGNLDNAIEALFKNGISVSTPGLHTFNIRVKDDQNNWGPVFKFVFNATTPLTIRNVQVTLAELFFDIDPGQGNGTTLIAFDGNFNDAIETITGNITSLPSTGLHVLNIRVRDGQNNWGPTFKTVISVTNPLTLRQLKITLGELFFDTDPGQGSGIPLIAFDGNFNDAIETLSGSITSLPSAGIHLLNIRVRDDQNNWGPTFKTIINVTNPLALRQIKITTAEFFFDSDPGLGNGYQLYAFDGNFNDAIETIYRNFNFLPDTGLHILNIRAKDANNTWGPVFKTVLRILPCTSQPTVTISPTITQTICPGDSVLLTAQSGFSTYTWFRGGTIVGTGQNFYADTAGFYRVYAVDANGCGVYSTFTQVKYNIFSANITASGPTTFCQGGSVVLTAASNNSSYNWNTGSTAQSIIVASSGTFIVNVTNGNCLGSDTVVVTVHPNPPAPIISASGPTSFCPGDSVTLTCSPANTYSWNTNQYTQSIVVSNSGNYFVTITDVNGCQSSSSINVTVFPPPITSITNSVAICQGDSAQLTVIGGVSWQWTPAAGLNNFSIPNPMASPSISTQYSVVVTGLGGCMDSAVVSVFVNPVPNVSVSANNTVLCEGATLNLFASPNGISSYNWSGPAGFYSINQNPVLTNVTSANSGVYTLVGYNSAGCSDTETISIVVNSAPNAYAYANSNNLCMGDSLKLYGTPSGLTYTWTGPNGFTSNLQNPIIASINGTHQGMYIFTASNGQCTSSYSVSISINPSPNVIVTMIGTILTVAQSGANYQWVDCNNNFSAIIGETNQSYTATQNGDYAVIVVYNGCIDTSNCVNVTALSVEEFFNSTWSIYPHPNNGTFYVLVSKPTNFEVLDLTGRVIDDLIVNDSKTEVQLNLPTGLYFLREKESGVTHKLIIE